MTEQLRIRDNGTIREIQIPKANLEELKRLKDKHFFSEHFKQSKVRELSGGSCCICGFYIPKFEVTYDVSDEKQSATKIERYCEKCVKRVYEREPVL